MELVAEKYKQTEVGLIPSDWEVDNLLQNFTLKARIGWQGLTTAEYRQTGEYGLVTGTDFKNGYIDWDNCVYVERSRFIQDKNIQLNVGDVLVTKDGTIGKVAYVDKLPNPTTLNSGVFVVRTRNLNIDNRYFYYLLMSSYFDVFLAKITAGSTITHLYQKDFVTFNFVLPPTKAEQTAIATALSDTDALISSLEKLIAKKRNIKQGAMQQLLKPKEGWEVKKLGEVIYLQGGYAFKSELFTNVGVPIIRISDVGNNKVETDNSVCYEPFNIPKEFVAKKGDVLIAMSGATTGKIGVYNYDGIAYINQRVGKFVVLNQNETSQEFISHIVRSEKFKENLTKEIAQGAQPNISGKQIQSIVLPIPNEKEEQDRIATILSDMDAEIAALETKLEKYKKVKLGMMQNLLTGKIRLI